MFFGSKRKKATLGAEAGLRPIIAVAQVKGGLSSFSYSDPYILGYLTHIAIFFAKYECRGKYRPEDLGFAIQDSFSAVLNLDGKHLAEQATSMMVDRHPDFTQGGEDASVYCLFATGQLTGHENIPLLKEARSISGGLSAQMFGVDEATDIGGNLMHLSFLKRVEELRKGFA